LKHFNYLSDDFGIWQHTRGKIIDKRHGYALDDAARALIVALEYGSVKQARIFLDFIREATRNGRIVNFFGPDRSPLSRPSSEDALGESYWAVAFAHNKKLNPEVTEGLIEKLNILALDMKSLRGKSYSLLGSLMLGKKSAHKLASDIETEYLNNKRKNWSWPEGMISYANAIIPLSLIEYGQVMKRSSALNSGIEMLDFLNRVTKVDRTPIAIGNKGWFARGRRKEVFDQQPIDIAYQVLANVRAFENSNDNKYLVEARNYFHWFWGNNLAEKPLIDASDWSCLDGIQENKLSSNRGAESVICYLLAEKAIEPYLDEKV